MDVMGYVKEIGYNGFAAKAFEYDSISDESHFALLNDGWKLEIHNNFPSLEAAYNVMADGIIDENMHPVYAHQEYCRKCDRYASVSKVLARYWSDHHNRWVIFNGRACEMCQSDFDYVKFRGQMKTSAQIERILHIENTKH